MKRGLLLILNILFALILHAEGWRAGEQQVIITVDHPDQIELLKGLKVSFEPCGSNQVRAYLIPKEKQNLESLNFNIETEIEDLNKHFEHFWLTEDFYHSYQQIIDLADSLEEYFPAICKKYIFGTSLGGRQLAALKISDNVLIDEPEPEVFFDGGIHGDEIGGSENIIRFARDLCLGYESNGTITYLINNREIWLYLMVNPDGRVNMVRYNNNGVDLNRDCGYMWDQDGSTFGLFGEVESKALLTCNLQNQFVIYTSYHSGTEYVSYPWSYRPDATPDHLHINQLAQVYVNQSGYSNLPYGQGYSGMYPINGSTKDSYYGITGSVSWSIEISMSKQPPASQIMMYYNYNKPSMLALIEYAGYGLQGIITDATNGEPVAAMVFVNNSYPCYSDPEVGDYHKYVVPGTYTITVKANGYQTQTISNVIVTTGSSTTTNFQLIPQSSQFAFKFIASRIPGNNFSDEGNTPAALSAPDQINYSLGKNGYCVLDMQYPIPDGSGPDIKVYEGDSSPEGFTLFAGNSIDGPWTSLGPGNGTTAFDLDGSGLFEARYLKIVDDGDGIANAANAGFDLDAVEAMEPLTGVYLVMTDHTIDDSNGNNNGLIDPGESIVLSMTLKNNGNIISSNTIATMATASPFVTITSSSANFGNLTQGESGTGTFAMNISNNTPQGQSFSLIVNISANAGSYTKTFLLNFSVGLIIENWETGDFSKFDWQSGGNSNWTITNVNPFEGTYCAKSGAINHNQSTHLSITYNVLSGGEISFYKKVSSESGYDFLSFYIDNVLQEAWSGEVAWSMSSFPVNSGYHTFKWEYSKDVSVAGGSDCSWLDYIILPSGAAQGLTAFFIADQTHICSGDIVNFTDYSIGNVTSWNWTFPGGSPSSSTQQNPSVQYNSAGLFDVSLTVSDGSNSQTLTLDDYISVSLLPQAPQIPQGEQYPFSLPGYQYEYNIPQVTYADTYEWVAEPADAIDNMVNNGTSVLIDFTDYWSGTVVLKVRAVNVCGEGSFSEEFTIFVINTGINDHPLNSIQVNPNPSKGLMSLYFKDSVSEQVKICITNNLGKIIFEETVTLDEHNRSYKIDLSGNESGIYFLILYKNEHTITQKLLIL